MHFFRAFLQCVTNASKTWSPCKHAVLWLSCLRCQPAPGIIHTVMECLTKAWCLMYYPACSRQPFLTGSVCLKNLPKVQCWWELGITSGKLIKETTSIPVRRTDIQVNIAQNHSIQNRLVCFPFHVAELAQRSRCVYVGVCKSQVTDPRWWAWGTLRSSFGAGCFVAAPSLSLCPDAVIWSQLKWEQELNGHKEPLLISGKQQIRSRAEAKRCAALLGASLLPTPLGFVEAVRHFTFYAMILCVNGNCNHLYRIPWVYCIGYRPCALANTIHPTPCAQIQC